MRGTEDGLGTVYVGAEKAVTSKKSGVRSQQSEDVTAEAAFRTLVRRKRKCCQLGLQASDIGLPACDF